ncbi:7TM diverse intracellular signaling domain-containing protein [Adhaeribacter soli]|uniref:7TM-DISM receptor extracellular domain-containing protein n=1 Tax=Adhaeribacter soli TaxID=2607655 RepID=A0A5N1IKR8_9BACT|nr:7TM diverse intracellular signaling domain-containing protein [Adhaeribacter soli]KAA9325706.1 hypothetical protein F0P94_17385 [Adhaeribacter soli]
MPRSASLQFYFKLSCVFSFLVIILGWTTPLMAAGESREPKITWQVLEDKGYTFERVRTDPALKFIPIDSLRAGKVSRYWLKITAANQSSFTASYQLRVLPYLDNTLFQFNPDTEKWELQRAGVYAPSDNNRTRGRFSMLLPGKSTSVIYVKVNLTGPTPIPAAVKLSLQWEKEAEAQEAAYFFGAAWIVSLALLVILFLNNLHLYYRFRDSTIAYFLILQVGGMLYITAYRFFFNIAFPSPVFNLRLTSEGKANFYDLNQVLMHLSVALILFGSVQFTRSYLQTKLNLPKLDSWLRYALYTYLTFTAIVMLINITVFCINPYTIGFDNLLVLGVVTLLVITGIIAYRRNIPFAKPYLYANLVPIFFIFSVAFYHVFFSSDNAGRLVLPDLAIISLGLCFSVVTVSRLQTLRDSLAVKEEEARHLANEIRRREKLHRQITLENEQIQDAFRETENQRNIKELENRQLNVDILEGKSVNKELQKKLADNHRELASITLYMEQKNAMLAKLKLQIEELPKLNPNNKHKELSEVKSLLQSNLHLDDDWSKFRLHFEQVHPNFFQDLQAKYPNLTKNELRLYSYFHINLTTKEIATLLNIEPASVRRAKTRLFKKIAEIEEGLNPEKPEAENDDASSV